MNEKAVGILEEVILLVEAEYNRVDMGIWCRESSKTPCGTVACIAGLTAIVVRARDRGILGGMPLAKHPEVNSLIPELTFYVREIEGRSIDRQAADALGLSYDERERLFFTTDWPTGPIRNFRKEYSDCCSGEEEGKLVIDRLRFFIETNGTDMPVTPPVQSAPPAP